MIKAILLVKIIVIVMNAVAMMMTVLEKMQGSRKIEVYTSHISILVGDSEKVIQNSNSNDDE